MGMRKFPFLLVCAAVMASPVSRAEDLLSIYQQTVEADPKLNSAAFKSAIGGDQKSQALGAMLPQINATGSWSQNTQSTGNSRTDGNYFGTRYYVSMTQSLIDFAKFWGWRRAISTEEQYQTELIVAQQDSMFNVVERYFNVLQAEDELFFIRTEKEAVAKQLEQFRKQFEKQLIKITDIYAIEARLDEILAEETVADSKLSEALQSIKELTGFSPSALDKLRDDIEFKEMEGDLNDWIEVAKSQNPDVLARNHAIEAAKNDLTMQKSKHLPVVELQLNFYDTNMGYQNVTLGSSVQTQTAAINVNMPIFSGGVTSSQVSESQHRLELNKSDQEAEIRALARETSDAFLLTNSGVKHIKAAQKMLASASKNNEAISRGFHYGLFTVNDSIKAQQAEFSARKDLAKAKYDYIKSRTRFMRAIGSISPENLFEINDWLQKDKFDGAQAELQNESAVAAEITFDSQRPN